MSVWMLRMEEHALYLFCSKQVSTTALKNRGDLSVKGRERALAMNSVCEGNLQDELQTLWRALVARAIRNAIRASDSQLIQKPLFL